MLKVENIESWGWEAAIRGMRNPMNSWNKIDSEFYTVDTVAVEDRHLIGGFSIGPNDLDLALRLIKAGPEHRKFLRMIHVQMDITGPLYWWKEMDTYKVATVANSCSTMHKIATKEFGLSDFSHEHLHIYSWNNLNSLVDTLNFWRDIYLNGGMVDNLDGTSQVFEPKDKNAWWQLIQLLPSSYNQLRTWDASLATVLSICEQRKGHKLDEWEQFRQACFDNIPYCQEFYDACYSKEAKNQVETN